ncbi:uncharacterized protein LOC130238774 [Danio aesculapii]|uniref:uncharacterized protein LOC130238774 n=1 Tax=Danio aesculapii TaxID=1142201 RepID=UPI0024C08A9B|nr:uncharacterized protein LOC130238774 [Danio aesculapii]
MNAVNAVQLFLLVWSFSTVCHGDTDVSSVSCDDVTGTVGNEVIFTCRVSEKCTEYCVKLYKFQYPEKNNDSEICRQELSNDICEKRNIFTCRYTPDTTIKGTFRFFLQSACGIKTSTFTVEISERMKSTADTGVSFNEEENKYAGALETQREEKQDRGFKLAVILAVVSCFIIVIIMVAFKVKRESTHLRLRLEESTASLDNV